MYQSTMEILTIMCRFKVIQKPVSESPWLAPAIYNLINCRKSLTRRYECMNDPDLLWKVRVVRNRLNSTVDKAKGSLH